MPEYHLGLKIEFVGHGIVRPVALLFAQKLVFWVGIDRALQVRRLRKSRLCPYPSMGPCELQQVRASRNTSGVGL